MSKVSQLNLRPSEDDLARLEKLATATGLGPTDLARLGWRQAELLIDARPMPFPVFSVLRLALISHRRMKKRRLKRQLEAGQILENEYQASLIALVGEIGSAIVWLNQFQEVNPVPLKQEVAQGGKGE